MRRMRPRFVSLVAILAAQGWWALPALALPGPPVNLRARPQSTTAVVLEWLDTASDETRFRIERRTGDGQFTFVRNLAKNKQSVVVSGLPPGTFLEFRVRAENAKGTSFWSEAAGVFTDRQDAPSTCLQGASTLCLGGGSSRFRVESRFRGSPSQPFESLEGTELNADTGLFYFPFSAPNAEVIVKILNACALNTRFWAFAGGVSSIETTITVTDTQNGRTRTYLSPAGKPFVTFQDTEAFATCP
jgi:hypothetical protein